MLILVLMKCVPIYGTVSALVASNKQQYTKIKHLYSIQELLHDMTQPSQLTYLWFVFKRDYKVTNNCNGISQAQIYGLEIIQNIDIRWHIFKMCISFCAKATLWHQGYKITFSDTANSRRVAPVNLDLLSVTNALFARVTLSSLASSNDISESASIILRLRCTEDFWKPLRFTTIFGVIVSLEGGNEIEELPRALETNGDW